MSAPPAAEYFRERAEEMRRRFKQASTPALREQLELLLADYEELATSAEARLAAMEQLASRHR